MLTKHQKYVIFLTFERINLMNNENKSQRPDSHHDNSVAIYTTFKITQEMRKKLGVEAMLEYVDNYCLIIEEFNPQVKTAVSRALSLIDVNRIYDTTLKNKKGS